MVVLIGSYLKRDLNEWVKCLDAMPGKIGLRFKSEFVRTQFHGRSFLQQVGDAAVIIGFAFRDLVPGSTFQVK